MNHIKNKKIKVAIVGCVHGDEVIGKKIINELKDLKFKKGSLGFFIANQPALSKNKRFIKQDLNRSFPGNINGVAEEKIAYSLKNKLNKFDVVIDIHATNSNIDKLAIVTRFDSKIKNLLKLIPANKVALIRKNNFGGKALINYVKLGISLEYGPNKSGKNYKKCLKDIKIILTNLELLPGRKNIFKSKELYTVSGSYEVSNNFRPTNCLKDFQLIKKGQFIGQINQKKIKATKSFYPIFLGKGRYKKTLALTAKKERIEL
ncbi:succinylglutamate desuccinylase/aspartoacylase family protein [Patescibacteria group bacterium]|nr:succinylglutamate desuccinylase/aspartoacylase family protein [Patescibacteria group bacterium]